MKTDDLINALSLDAASKGMPPSRALSVALAIGAFTAVIVFLLALGTRPDFALAVEQPRFLLKFAVTLSLALGSWMLLERLARPAARQARALHLLLLPLGLIAVGIAAELIALPSETWARSLIGSNAVLCLVSIPLISVGPFIAALLALRQGAPLSPAKAGAVAGLAAGALGATLYAAHCTDDSPLFVATWYTLALALMATLGAGLGSRMLRW